MNEILANLKTVCKDIISLPASSGYMWERQLKLKALLERLEVEESPCYVFNVPDFTEQDMAEIAKSYVGAMKRARGLEGEV